MINNIRYVEQQVAQNFGDSFHDLENTNYWELLKMLAAKGGDDEDGSENSNNNSDHMNAYDFLKNNPI